MTNSIHSDASILSSITIDESASIIKSWIDRLAIEARHENRQAVRTLRRLEAKAYRHAERTVIAAAVQCWRASQ